MASPEDVGARRQTFYEIECVIEDCDSEVGYKPLSDSDELDDSAEEEEPREEDIDSSEEWEPLMRSKLKRHASSSPSSSLPRRRGRPPKTALNPSSMAPVMGSMPRTTPAISLPRRRGRPPKDKSKVKLFPKPSLYPTIVPKPPPFATLIPNSASGIKFGPNTTPTFTLGSNFTPITLSNPTSSIKLDPNSTPILIQNPTSTFKLSQNSTSTLNSAPIATLICTPTSTGLLLDADTNEIKTLKEEKPWEDNVDASEEWPVSLEESLECSESPNAKRQRLSSTFPPAVMLQQTVEHTSKITPSPLPELAPIATSDHAPISQTTTIFSFQPIPTTINEPLTSIPVTETTPIPKHKPTCDPNPNPAPIQLRVDSDINSDLDGDIDEMSDSGREEELWEEDVDSGEDWNLLLESPERSKSPASAQSPRRSIPPTPTSPRGKLSISTSELSPEATPTNEATIHPALEATPTTEATIQIAPEATPTTKATIQSVPEATPTTEATIQPASEATPPTTHNSSLEATPIPSPAPTLPRRRGRPRKHALKPTLTLEPAPTATPNPTPAADSTPIAISDPTLTLSLVPAFSTNSEPNPEPATTSKAIPQPTSTGEKSKPDATSYSLRQARGRSSSALDSPWMKVVNDSKPDKWLDINNEDEEPVLPIFSPKHPPGPQLMADSTYTPLQLFQLFFTSSTVKTIVRNTNSNAEKRAKSGMKFLWVPLTVAEFYSYVAIVVYMGLVKAKSIADYWARKRMYNFPYPQSVMSRARFQAISWNLHLCDLQKDEENNKKKGTPGYDRLLKIKPLYTDVLLACKTHFHPNREISVDERMVATKARIGLKPYMNDKPTKWGYRLFVLADSSCGYTWNFFVYEGKTSTSSGKGVGYDSVIRLVDHKALGKGYRLYTDNFYTSPTLFLDLLQNDILACGALRQTSSLPETNDLSGRSERGSVRWCRQGPLLFVKWMVAREVLMCSTIHKAFTGDSVTRNTKGADGVWKTRQIPVPSAVKDYSKYMGGVDLSDSLIEYYNVLQKTTKWYKIFFFHFLDIAVVNSFILHQHLAKAQNKIPLTHKLFRETLVSELARAGRGKNPSAPAAKDPSTSTSKESAATSKSPHVPSTPVESNMYLPSDAESSPPPSPAQTEQCFPEYFGSDATHGRRVCVMCKLQGNKVKTPIYCSHCKVALCFVSSRNCFKKWHIDGHPGDL
ncbi:mucin-5AC-like [Megalobrama amblycephala]|uniref:mucin-5AC-like n=1 Tax=Megalobrama amblycephala TaxID=75352 RepID=UPI0020143A50|nr:mucin-5AC-like [Megalobrama amblycephala]